MKKYKFTITNTREETMEGEDAQDARQRLIEDEVNNGRGHPDDYIDRGIEV